MHTRYGVRAAVAWRIITELVRRHQTTCRLRVLETHPGGGQYDCLSLGFSRGTLSFAVRLCDFNVGSQRLHIWNTFGEPRARLQDLKWPHGNDYVQPFLESLDPKNVATLGLPVAKTPTPVTTPATLVLRVIASVMERNAFSRLRVEARCCWHDSSGMEGSYAESWIKHFPDLQQRLLAIPFEAPWREHTRIAGRVWKLDVAGKDGALLLDMGSGRACRIGERFNVALGHVSEERAHGRSAG